MKKIVFTGGTGRFAGEFKKIKSKFMIYFPDKKKLNIENLNSIEKFLKKIKPSYFIHCAALSRPMNIHERNISQSITTNIIGTSNVVKACEKQNVKLIYFSTNYIYPGIKGDYKENDPILPINNYAISKLGGECAVRLYKNSLILRISMTEKPFVHEFAFNDVEMNFMYHEDFAKILLKLIDKKGIINVGGKKQTVYNFIKQKQKNIKPISGRKMINKKFPLKQSMNLSKLKKILKNK
jgi:dTDP-4-dehydrorhamnose reductase